MNTYEIWRCDALNYGEEGWIVNDCWSLDLEAELPEDFTKEDVQKYFSVPIEIDDSNEGVIYVEREDTGEPLAEFRLIEDEIL